MPDHRSLNPQVLDQQEVRRLAHDLRSPLQLVSGYADLLAEETAGALNPKQKKYVAAIREGVQKVTEVLDEWKALQGQTIKAGGPR